MDQGLIPRRYAKALYKFAVTKKTSQGVYTLMQNIAEAFEAQPTLQATVANPFVSDKDKTDLILTAAGVDPKSVNAAGNTPGDTLADFVKLLIANRRIDMTRLTALAYIALYRDANRIYGVQISSAAPLDDADRRRISAMVESHLKGATAEFSYAVDPSLIGGFVVTVNSERLDASVKNELQQLGRKLASA